MAKKVDNVRIDKKVAMEENFRKKGLPELLSEVNFSIDITERPRELTKKFISAVKRTFKKDYFGVSDAEKWDYFKRISIHDIYQVEMTKLNPNEDIDFYNYIRELIYYCQPKAQRSKVEDVEVARILIKNGSHETEGYAVLNGEAGSSYHRTRRAFRARKSYGYKYIFDISTLIAETIMFQSIIDFSEKNKDLVKYMMVNSYLNSDYGPKIPVSDEFKKDYIEVANKYRFSLENVEESEVLEKEKDSFYVQKSMVGNENSPFNDKLIYLMIGEFIRESEYVQYKTNEELKERSEYAKAFQTKKQIKKTHEEKMKFNAFLDRYGYTELDNDVCLKKFKVIEENFRELYEKIYIPYRKDYDFRIKKLGKHRAAGVFFPFYKTTIFDLNHPDAYVHELFHQIDYILAEGKREDYYSEMMDFRPIYDAYKKLISKQVNSLSKGDSFRNQWEGKTKYNKSYYLKPTEVFARSGEIYIALKGIDNSLMKTREDLEKEHVYTFEESFLQKLVLFFDNLFEELKKKQPIEQPAKKSNLKKRESAAVGSGNRVRTIEEQPKNFEQLSLF